MAHIFCFPWEYKGSMILASYTPSADHSAENSVPNGLIARAVFFNNWVVVPSVCIEEYRSVGCRRPTNVFERETDINVSLAVRHDKRPEQFHIFNSYPRTAILAHFAQLTVEYPVRSEGENRRQSNDDQHSVLTRSAFAVLSAVLLALGVKMFAYSVDVEGDSVPKSLISFVAGLALFLIAGVVLFVFAWDLPALHPH